MSLELSANHRDERRKSVKRVGRRVDTHECVTRSNPVDKTLFIRQRQITRRTGENYAVIILEIRWRECSQHLNHRGHPSCMRDLINFVGFLPLRHRREEFRRLVTLFARARFRRRLWFTRRLPYKIDREITAALRRELREYVF